MVRFKLVGAYMAVTILICCTAVNARADLIEIGSVFDVYNTLYNVMPRGEARLIHDPESHLVWMDSTTANPMVLPELDDEIKLLNGYDSYLIYWYKDGKEPTWANEWRLPTFHELEHLWSVELGNTSSGTFTQHPFLRLRESQYWTSTELIDPYYYGFNMSTGEEFIDLLARKSYGLFVRDVQAENPVPEPSSIFLFGSGVMGLCGFIRKRSVRSCD